MKIPVKIVPAFQLISADLYFILIGIVWYGMQYDALEDQLSEIGKTQKTHTLNN